MCIVLTILTLTSLKNKWKLILKLSSRDSFHVFQFHKIFCLFPKFSVHLQSFWVALLPLLQLYRFFAAIFGITCAISWLWHVWLKFNLNFVTEIIILLSLLSIILKGSRAKVSLARMIPDENIYKLNTIYCIFWSLL